MSSSFPSTGTTLSTARLLLRPWTVDELAAVITGRRLPHWAEDFPAEGDVVIAGVIAQQSNRPGEHGHQLIVEQSTGTVVGSISVLWPPTGGTLEVGYGVVASRRGRGYATESTRALVDLALSLPEVHTVYADVERSNPASIRVLEKAGLRLSSEDATTARYGTTVSERSRR